MAQSQLSCASTYTTQLHKVSLKRLLPVLTRSKTNASTPVCPSEAHHGIEKYQHHDGSEVEGAMEGEDRNTNQRSYSHQLFRLSDYHATNIP